MVDFIMDDGIRLNIKLDMPKNFTGKCPLVIVIHGFTGHMEERHITAVSSMLNQIGCASLRVDMYGHGSSGGEFRNHIKEGKGIYIYRSGARYDGEWKADMFNGQGRLLFEDGGT